jgi:RNA recognition motif-containing protein
MEFKEEEIKLENEVSSTIQVTNIDVNTSNDKLEEFFGDFGPLKRCFVVRPKQTNLLHTKGIVQFALSDDAEKVIQETSGLLKVEGQTLTLTRIPDAPQKPGQKGVSGTGKKFSIVIFSVFLVI